MAAFTELMGWLVENDIMDVEEEAVELQVVERMPFSMTMLHLSIVPFPSTISVASTVATGWDGVMKQNPGLFSKHGKIGLKNSPELWQQVKTQFMEVEKQYKDNPMPMVSNAGKLNMAGSSFAKVCGVRVWLHGAWLHGCMAAWLHGALVEWGAHHTITMCRWRTLDLCTWGLS
jgi:hypothetical protein